MEEIFPKFFFGPIVYINNQWSFCFVSIPHCYYTSYSTVLQAKPCSIKTVEYGGIQKSIEQCGILTKIETPLIFVSTVQNILKEKFSSTKTIYKHCSFVPI